MKPTRGLIVDFFHAASAGGSHVISPALIHSVNDKGVALLHIFGPSGTRVQPGVTKGFAPNQWNFLGAEPPAEASADPIKLPSSTGNEAA